MEIITEGGKHDALKNVMEFQLRKAEEFQQRYIEAETFLRDYHNLPWWKRTFFGKKIIIDYFASVLEKYK